ncbi:MAG: glycosyl transferase [Chitinophagales bacterium]|nr:MAG: glycosyl transferase [Chitinophagales bacterium]
MKKVKILHVENSCWDIYKFRTPMLEQMKEMGMEVILVAPLDEYFGRIDTALYDGYIETNTLKAQRISPLADLRYLLELKKILLREKPDLALFYTIKPSIYGGFASQWTGTTAIAFLTGLGYTFYNGKFLRRLVTWMSKKAFRRLEKVVVLNKDDRQKLIETGVCGPEKLFILPSEGIDTIHFNPMPKTNNSDKFIFLFIGRLIAAKGIRELIAATKVLKSEGLNFECWIVGDFNYANPSVISQKELNTWIAEKYIRYLGPTDDVRQFIRNADVIVLPSHFYEGKPRVLQEAMAMAKPIITTFTPGCREMVIHGENGLLVPPGDAMALSEAMRYMMELPKEAIENMGINGLKLVESNYSEIICKSIFKTIILHSLNTNEKKIEDKLSKVGTTEIM